MTALTIYAHNALGQATFALDLLSQMVVREAFPHTTSAVRRVVLLHDLGSLCAVIDAYEAELVSLLTGVPLESFSSVVFRHPDQTVVDRKG